MTYRPTISFWKHEVFNRVEAVQFALVVAIRAHVTTSSTNKRVSWQNFCSFGEFVEDKLRLSLSLSLDIATMTSACETCGWLAAVGGMLAFGSFGVPIKSKVAQTVDIDPLAMQTYKTTMCLLTSWLVLLYGMILLLSECVLKDIHLIKFLYFHL